MQKTYKIRRVEAFEVRTPEGIRRIERFEPVSHFETELPEEVADIADSPDFVTPPVFEGIANVLAHVGDRVIPQEIRFPITGVLHIDDAFKKFDECIEETIEKIKAEQEEQRRQIVVPGPSDASAIIGA
jgi:hypothetical protein